MNRFVTFLQSYGDIVNASVTCDSEDAPLTIFKYAHGGYCHQHLDMLVAKINAIPCAQKCTVCFDILNVDSRDNSFGETNTIFITIEKTLFGQIRVCDNADAPSLVHEMRTFFRMVSGLGISDFRD
jgi:hypothetical protein